MSEAQNEGTPDPNEIQEEEEVLQEKPDDKIRARVMEEYGLDEAEHSELIGKIVQDKLEGHKKLSTAIEQKRKWREKALKAPTEQKPEAKPQAPVVQPKVEDFEKVLDQKLNERLEQRELDSLDLSDELKSELKVYAKAKGLSVKQAESSEYIEYLKGREETKRRVEEASIGGKHRTPTRKDFASAKPSDFDLSTEEGRNGWEEYKKSLKERG